MEERQLDRLVAEINQAKGTADEIAVTKQAVFGLANIAAAEVPSGNFEAASLIRQLQATGDIGTPATNWVATGTDGTPIICIVSTSNSQIIWQKTHAEMNPSIARWNNNCALSSPKGQLYVQASIVGAKIKLESLLRDPDGTHYRDVHAYASMQGVYLCGQINVRNGFGGFVGYSRFIASSNSVALPTDDGIGDAVIVRDWPIYCGGAYRDMGQISLP